MANELLEKSDAFLAEPEQFGQVLIEQNKNDQGEQRNFKNKEIAGENGLQSEDAEELSLILSPTAASNGSKSPQQRKLAYFSRWPRQAGRQVHLVPRVLMTTTCLHFLTLAPAPSPVPTPFPSSNLPQI